MNTELHADDGTLAAGERWRRTLAALEVPRSIAGDEAEKPVMLPPERFRWKPDEDAAQPVRPSRRRALEALPEGGSVLDVGVGGGASSLGLAPKVGLIVGVDHNEGMLELFQASAREAGIEPRAVLGLWPDVADQVEPVDVAVCHHVMYRVREIEQFADAMTATARHRVVVELSAHPPLAGLNALWKAFHGLDRPEFLVADAAQEALLAAGLPVEREDIVLPPRSQPVTPESVAFARERLHVGPERDAEIEEFLRNREPQEQRVVALWWPGRA